MKYSTEAYNLTSLCAVSCGISSLHWYRSSVRKPLYNYRKIYLKPNWCPLNFPGLEKVIAIFHLYICRRLNNHFPCPIFISDQPSLPCSPPGATTHPPHNKYCKQVLPFTAQQVNACLKNAQWPRGTNYDCHLDNKVTSSKM